MWGGMAWLVFVLRVLVGGLLLAAGALKVTHPESLAAAISGYRLLPSGVVLPLAIALPPLELLFGAYLVAGLFTRQAGVVTAAMFAAYAAAVASAVVRHIPASCGCFGPNDTATADWPHVGFDAVLALAALAIARWAPGALAVDRLLHRNLSKETHHAGSP